ncbi:hypothetical protein D3C75_978910 [compost metagenome]
MQDRHYCIHILPLQPAVPGNLLTKTSGVFALLDDFVASFRRRIIYHKANGVGTNINDANPAKIISHLYVLLFKLIGHLYTITPISPQAKAKRPPNKIRGRKRAVL